jgi:hypothetical protein
MKYLKMIICLTFLVLVTSKALEGNEQTIGWGKAAASEEGIGGVADLNLVDELEDQHLGIGSAEDSPQKI